MGIFDKLRNKNIVPMNKASALRQADRVSGIPFPAYKGKEPYLFISYAHVDSMLVYPIISEFSGSGYNVWYDEGIEPGIEWPEEIANALDRCSLFIVFMSPAAASSPNVRNEINFALAKKGLPFIAVHIRNTTLTPGLQLQMGAKQAILKYNMDDESFRRKYTYSFEAVFKQPEKRKSYTPPSPTKELQNAFSDPSVLFPGGDFEIQYDLLHKYNGDAKQVRLPDEVVIIGGFAFYGCKNLESVVMSDNCGAILDNAFISCPNLSNITLGKNFSSLAKKAFIGCPYVRFSYYRDRMPDNLDQLFPDRSIISEIDEG